MAYTFPNLPQDQARSRRFSPMVGGMCAGHAHKGSFGLNFCGRSGSGESEGTPRVMDDVD